MTVRYLGIEICIKVCNQHRSSSHIYTNGLHNNHGVAFNEIFHAILEIIGGFSDLWAAFGTSKDIPD